MSGFKIIRIELEDNDYLDDLEFDLIDKKEINNGPYFSVIIGQNGTGKSNILRLFINLFRDLNHLQHNKSFGNNVSNRFNLLYSINDGVYSYSNIEKINGESFISIKNEGNKKRYVNLIQSKNNLLNEYILSNVQLDAKDVKLPNKILASSIMLTDKYPIVNKKEKYEIYEYLGVRRENSPGTAGTQTYINRTVEHIAESFNKKRFLEKVKQVLKFLNLEEKFVIQFTPRYRSKIFNLDLNEKILDNFFNKNEGLKRKTDLWGKDYFNSIKSDKVELNKIIEFCKNIRLKDAYEGSRSKVIEYDILSTNDFSSDYKMISHLRRLDLLSYPYFKIWKKGKEIDAEDSSSGEAHFISSLISIIATIEDNSLILIDEPELSLHPNWQMKYINFLNEIFAEYKGCHFIICTHSHFLISDLKAQNSKIIALERKDKLGVIDLPENLNTYGWSAEEVLYKVFNLKTTGNYFIEMELSKALSLIKNGEKSKDAFESIMKDLLALQLSEFDPLKEIINQIKDYYSKL